MRNSIIASTAMMASTALAGTAQVINSCPYDVYMANTPAQGGGYSAIDKVLSSGDSYFQGYLQLSNDQGWSLKLAKTPSYETNLLQYEYTFHNDGTIWYDLSQVDGNPWDGDWMITASGNCNPKQQAYRYATDDAYGMQSCPDSADITVTLCSGDDSIGAEPDVSERASAAPSSTGWEQTTQAQPTTTQAQPTTTQQQASHHGWTINADGFVGVAKNAAPSPTTLVTKQIATSTDEGGYDVTVTDVVTEVATAYVTAAKRHEHHPRHPHQVRQE